ncbi:MAG: phosphoribosylglycinamide formyltransferase [Betaproteobacteria bacterium]|nr:phosphoribosylglycinamide formyltransferase [Betaproteobacteria bacterium]
MKRIVILISGRGSNMEAILNARLPATLANMAAVISNDPAAKGLATAQAHAIPTAVVPHNAFATREAFEAALNGEIAEILRYKEPDLIVLAGFMRVLTEAFVTRYSGRMINIHPSLLPAFPGLHTHRRALQAGVRLHGCTVHFVTPGVDSGPIIAQAAVPVLANDDEDTLAARVLAQEHRIYPHAVRWFCEGRVKLGSQGAVEYSNLALAHGALLSPTLDEKS